MNSNIHVLIDEGMSTYKKPTGIGLHALNLYLHLRRFCKCEITNYEYMRYLPKGIRKFTLDLLINYKTVKRDYDIIHFQNHYVPFIKGKSKKFVTIHDLGVFHFPETVPFIYIKYNQHSIIKSLKRADAIITPSVAIKNEIMTMFNIFNEKIYVCNDGLRDVFCKTQPDVVPLQKLEIRPYSYFFFLGSLSKRKNLKFVLNAFIKAKKYKKIDSETLFVLGGQKWWGVSEFKELLKSEYGIKTLGYIDDYIIAQLYRFCKAFIFPSIYEGFGMPVIEAMSQGAPIIASNIPTNIELNNKHNKQMYVFDLNDEEALINYMTLIDKEFQSIRDNLNYGKLNDYYYDNVAEQHLKVYEKFI